MADILTTADFDLAFAFSRSEAAPWRDAGGAAQVAAPDVPRFDHDADGAPLGLLVTRGIAQGGADRVAIDPLILPADLVTPPAPYDGAVTVFHRYDAGSGEERRAWYSRNARATINALMAQAGHHREIGVIRGHKANEGGLIHYRGQAWLLPSLLASTNAPGAALLDNGQSLPVIACGAEKL